MSFGRFEQHTPLNKSQFETKIRNILHVLCNVLLTFTEEAHQERFMCNPSLLQTRGIKEAPIASSAFPATALSGLSPLPPAQAGTPRRHRWTAGELSEILDALSTLRTNDLAHMLGVNPKALRSVLRRNGVSLRALREHTKRKGSREGGLVVRRSTIGPSATYGAAALETLPNDACRWPLGDPADPGFRFCGARTAGRGPYCRTHLRQAFQHGDSK